MDENNNPNSMYDMDGDEGATTVLRAPEVKEEDDEEGATTVLRAEDIQKNEDESEGATTVLTGPNLSVEHAPKAPTGFTEQTQLLQPNNMGGPMPNGGVGGPMPNGPMGGPMPNGPMGGPMPNSPMPNGPMGGPMPNGLMGGPMPNNGQMPPVNGKQPKQPKPPKQPKMKKDGTPKKKKTGLIVAIIVVAVLGLGVGAYFLFFTPEKRYDRKMEEAEKAINASEYEKAEDAYDDALEIFDDRIQAMNGVIDAQIKLADYDEAREDYVKFRKTISAYEDAYVEENKTDIVTFYTYACDLYSDADSLIDAYKEGYELTGDGSLKALLGASYVERADAMDNADYEKKLAAYQDALNLNSEDKDAISGFKNCAYAVLDDMMASELYDEAEAFIEKYSADKPDFDFSSYTAKIESERALINARHDLMEQAMSLMAAGDYEGMLEVDGSENASLVVDNMEGDSYVYAKDGYDSQYSGKAVGIYTSSQGYYFYYGDYKDGIRSGQGTLFVKTDGYNKSYMVYEGAWANDKPNGSGKETSVNEDAGDELVTVERTGTLSEGLFDGEVTVSLISVDEEFGGTYTGTFTASKGEAPDVRANYPDYDFGDVSEDTIVYVVLTQDGSDLFWHFSMKKDAKLGIYSYGI